MDIYDLTVPQLIRTLRNLDATGQVYIRGHGAAGAWRIAQDREGQQVLEHTEVCDRLIRSGLPATFGGVIKFWNCESGLSSTGRTGKHRHSFAKRCADYLRDKGYRRCRYIGYTGTLSSYGEKDKRAFGDRAYHRAAWPAKGGKTRASEQQLEILPPEGEPELGLGDVL